MYTLYVDTERKRVGRPATGLTSDVLIIRLPKDIVATVKRRATQNRMSVNAYLLALFEHEYRPRASRTSYRSRSKAV